MLHSSRGASQLPSPAPSRLCNSLTARGLAQPLQERELDQGAKLLSGWRCPAPTPPTARPECGSAPEFCQPPVGVRVQQGWWVCLAPCRPSPLQRVHSAALNHSWPQSWAGRGGGAQEAGPWELERAGPSELGVRLDQVAAEGDVEAAGFRRRWRCRGRCWNMRTQTASPRQRQQQALRLHHAALAGLRVQHAGCVRVAHDVQIGLLVAPGVHVEAQEIDAGAVQRKRPEARSKAPVQADQLRAQGHRLRASTLCSPSLRPTEKASRRCGHCAPGSPAAPSGPCGPGGPESRAGPSFPLLPERPLTPTSPLLTCRGGVGVRRSPWSGPAGPGSLATQPCTWASPLWASVSLSQSGANSPSKEQREKPHPRGPGCSGVCAEHHGVGVRQPPEEGSELVFEGEHWGSSSVQPAVQAPG